VKELKELKRFNTKDEIDYAEIDLEKEDLMMNRFKRRNNVETQTDKIIRDKYGKRKIMNRNQKVKSINKKIIGLTIGNQ
jgi:hypothetical protein